jgi:hypothetical protein
MILTIVSLVCSSVADNTITQTGKVIKKTDLFWLTVLFRVERLHLVVATFLPKDVTFGRQEIICVYSNLLTPPLFSHGAPH